MNSEELVQLCKKMQGGDSAAFATLYEELYTPLYRFVYGLTFSREDAEDIVQEAFVKMAQAINRFSGGSVLAWLFTIARHTFYDRVRKYRKEVALDDMHESENVKHDIALDIDTARKQEDLMKNVKQLSMHERELVMLRYWQGLSMKQIAPIVGKTHDAVRQELSRLIKKLRKLTWTEK